MIRTALFIILTVSSATLADGSGTRQPLIAQNFTLPGDVVVQKMLLGLTLGGSIGQQNLIADAEFNAIIVNGSPASTTDSITYQGVTLSGSFMPSTAKFSASTSNGDTADVQVFVANLANTAKWLYGTTGVVGFGPNSEILKLLGAVSADAENSLYLVSEGDGTQYSPKTMDFGKSGLRLGGRNYVRDDNTPVYYTPARVEQEIQGFTFKSSNAYWFSNVDVTFETNPSTPNETRKTACLLSTQNFMIAIPRKEYEDLLVSAVTDLCDPDKNFKREAIINGTSACYGNNTDYTIDRIYPIYFEFRNDPKASSPDFKMQVNPVDFTEQFLGENEKKTTPAKFYFVPMTQDMISACRPEGSNLTPDIILGKLFLTQSELLVQVDNTGKVTKFGFNYMVEGDGRFFMVMGGLGIALIVSSISSIICLNMCAKRQKGEEDDEDEEDDEYEKAKEA